MISWYDWYRIGVDVVTLVIIPAGIWIAKVVTKIRTNDLIHIDADLKHFDERLDRIEKKIDDHIEWHLDNR